MRLKKLERKLNQSLGKKIDKENFNSLVDDILKKWSSICIDLGRDIAVF